MYRTKQFEFWLVPKKALARVHPKQLQPKYQPILVILIDSSQITKKLVADDLLLLTTSSFQCYQRSVRSVLRCCCLLTTKKVITNKVKGQRPCQGPKGAEPPGKFYNFGLKIGNVFTKKRLAGKGASSPKWGPARRRGEGVRGGRGAPGTRRGLSPKGEGGRGAPRGCTPKIAIRSYAGLVTL